MNNNEQDDPAVLKNDLAGEYKFGDAGQIVIAFLFGLVWISDTFILKYTTFANYIVPNTIRLPLGLILLLISGVMARTGLSIVFGEQKGHATVIRKSMFGIIRHPIYMSEIIMYFALLLFSLSLAAAFIWIIAIVFLHSIARHEERLCIKRYGEEYNRYIKDVPMWIPRLWKRKN